MSVGGTAERQLRDMQPAATLGQWDVQLRVFRSTPFLGPTGQSEASSESSSAWDADGSRGVLTVSCMKRQASALNRQGLGGLVASTSESQSSTCSYPPGFLPGSDIVARPGLAFWCADDCPDEKPFLTHVPG